MSAKRLILSLSLTFACPHGALAADWDAPQDPFPIYGGSYYVGPQGVASVLITSSKGHILIDGGTPKSAQTIIEHVRRLGFKPEDIKYILVSHAHVDHAGGVAQLQRLSGATVLTSPAAQPVLESGKPDRGDPQFGALPDMEPVENVKTVRDGEIVSVGPLAVKANYTPGHTRGGISWTWTAQELAGAMQMVYADSLNAFGLHGFRYSGDARYPEAKADIERSIARVAALPCDILVSAHPEAGGLFERHARQANEGSTAFIDRDASRRYADDGRQRLEKTLAQEAAARK
ncbi:subclass B3 metallo-beta-lactamase [Massilia brevitalea]|uniref:subclass B3 metallo-beta-lactamase n=1 Tax=Massilia brevitalea TaxID=442526 RepID=UPI002739C3D4|nr:subclass B3 metallo-beta-lactamase [Massilia brevitalea]